MLDLLVESMAVQSLPLRDASTGIVVWLIQ